MEADTESPITVTRIRSAAADEPPAATAATSSASARTRVTAWDASDHPGRRGRLPRDHEAVLHAAGREVEPLPRRERDRDRLRTREPRRRERPRRVGDLLEREPRRPRAVDDA